MSNKYGWGENELLIKSAAEGGDRLGTFGVKVKALFQDLFDKLNASEKTDATQAASGYMSAADKKKLDGISAGAQQNQNAMSNLLVDETTIAATSPTDTLTLVAERGITLSPDKVNKTVTIQVDDTTAIAKDSEYLNGREASYYRCANNCSWTCSSTCAGGCGNTCTGACMGCTGCKGSCAFSCGGSCSSTCTQSCGGNCTGGCTSGCTGACYGNCSGSCSGNCQTTCGGNCTGGCATTCTASCQSDCTSGCTSSCEENCGGGQGRDGGDY